MEKLAAVAKENRAGAMVQWLMLPALIVGDCGSNPTLGLKFKRNKKFLPRSFVNIKYCAEPRGRPQTTRARISNPVS